MRPACGWVELKPIVVFRDENREIKERGETLRDDLFFEMNFFETKSDIVPQTFMAPMFYLRIWPTSAKRFPTLASSKQLIANSSKQISKQLRIVLIGYKLNCYSLLHKSYLSAYNVYVY